MAMSVVYSNFCGRVVSENRGGVVSNYVADPLGSTIGLIDSAGTMTDRWEYWPYGEVVSRTGSNATPLTFLGVLGYFKDVLDKLFYVRARHLRVDLARWLTVDPVWPREQPYGYAEDSPGLNADPTGLSLHCSPGVSYDSRKCINNGFMVCECKAVSKAFPCCASPVDSNLDKQPNGGCCRYTCVQVVANCTLFPGNIKLPPEYFTDSTLISGPDPTSVCNNGTECVVRMQHS